MVTEVIDRETTRRRPRRRVTLGTIVYYDPTFTDDDVRRIEAEWAKRTAAPA
jgi:hypothetical protein